MSRPQSEVARIGNDHQLILVSDPICPFAQRVAITLLEKQVPFEQRWIDLKAAPDWFKFLSPTGKVPLLQVGEAGVLFESLPICEFVEETWPESPLHPRNPLERARHRAWMEQVSPLLADMWALLTEGTNSERRDRLISRLKGFEEASSVGPFFGGDSFSLVDAVIAPFFRYFGSLPPETVALIDDAVPRLSEWRTRSMSRQSVKAAVPEDFRKRLAEFLAEMRQGNDTASTSPASASSAQN